MTEHQTPTLRWESLRPYVTVVVLQCTAEDRSAALAELEAYLTEPGRRQANRSVDIVALSRSADTAAEVAAQFRVDQLGGFVRRSEKSPAWAGSDAGFLDVAHDLTVALRLRDLVAVRVQGDVEERLQRRLNKEPRLPFQRLPPVVLENALLRGETKGLWLRGTHPRSTLRPDVKNLGGLSLEEAANPWEDSSFAVGSARAMLADDAGRVVLKGTIGTTPSRSSVWFKASADFPEFVTAVLELLVVLEQELATGSTQPQVLTVFARQVTELVGSHAAYDIAVLDPDLLGGTVADEVYEAAEELEDATLIVHDGTDADFKLEVGLGGSVGGRLAATLSPSNGEFVLKIGGDPATEPTDSESVGRVRDALQYPRLLSVYYKSGHAYVGGEMWTTRIPKDPFPNWDFQDFSGYFLKQEKPATKVPQEIHDQIGDGSTLFDWVAQYYDDGWLTCDDGSGEMADFVHIAGDGTLTFIHVKGAGSDSPNRRVSVTAYEVVTSQATWTHGVRIADRTDLLDAFDSRSASRSAAGGNRSAASERGDPQAASRGSTADATKRRPHAAVPSGESAAYDADVVCGRQRRPDRRQCQTLGSGIFDGQVGRC